MTERVTFTADFMGRLSRQVWECMAVKDRDTGKLWDLDDPDLPYDWRRHEPIWRLKSEALMIPSPVSETD